MSSTAHQSVDDLAVVLSRYRQTRQTSLEICKPLQDEDYVVQSMPDVSPTKWHLAHTSWFFENFLLRPHLPGYREFNSRFNYLFNSYYYLIGDMHKRALRGVLTRPTVAETRDYREYIDTHMARLLEEYADNPELIDLVVLGINHEQQHQELILTDIKHVFWQNPLFPTYRSVQPLPFAAPTELDFVAGKEGQTEIGFAGDGFCFDNEKPRHEQILRPHAIANRLVTNGEFRQFIDDGGYTNSKLWLSDAWITINENAWRAPMYWSDDLEQEFTLGGMRPIIDNEPVCHVSYFEADAFARWAGYRLPTEAEWESVAVENEANGNQLAEGQFHPCADTGKSGIRQLFGDCWEWTCSPYIAYPGYEPPNGAIGEYNGKFMCNQWVLRGGSCVTPNGHIRYSYRNFFYAPDRWQFSGIRLAKNLT